jgi:hypothetical protein
MTATAIDPLLDLGSSVADPIRVLLVDARVGHEHVLGDALVPTKPTPGDQIEFYVEAIGVTTHLREENGAWTLTCLDRVPVRPGQSLLVRCR